MQRLEVNVQTGERKVIELTPEEIAATLVDNSDRIAERAPKPKKLTVDAIEALLKKAGVSDADIEAAKT